MSISKQDTHPSRRWPTGAAEAFYTLFRTLPAEDKLAVARYILEDEDVRRNGIPTDIPNKTTLSAFAEKKDDMPVFESIEALREDLLS